MAAKVEKVAGLKKDVERIFVYNKFCEDFYDSKSYGDKFKTQWQDKM